MIFYFTPAFFYIIIYFYLLIFYFTPAFFLYHYIFLFIDILFHTSPSPPNFDGFTVRIDKDIQAFLELHDAFSGSIKYLYVLR